MNSKRDFGLDGERLAVEFLRKNNYRVLERNFRIRNGEIDIIAIDTSEKEHVLTFIEVKTRSSNQFGSALESITPWKINFLIRTANVYKHMHKNLPELLRIDAVTIDYQGSDMKIDLVKNIAG